MNRRHWLIGGVAVGAAVAGTSAALWQAHRSRSGSDAIWRLQFTRPDGSSLAMASQRGAPLLLNFWATWCPPCVTELPLLDRFSRQQSASRWQVVGLAVDQTAPVKEFLSRHPVSYPIALATENGLDIARQLGNREGALPFSVVFDSAGNITVRKLGILSAGELQSWVAAVH